MIPYLPGVTGRIQHFPVAKSNDLDRVIDLARRPPLDLDPNNPRTAALVEIMTERLRRPDRPPGSLCGCRELGRSYCINKTLPVQAWALWEAPLAGGLLAPIGVGAGKTFLDIMMAMVMPDCKVAALLAPPGLILQLQEDYAAIAEHFLVPSLILPNGYDGGRIYEGRPSLHVVPYSILQRPEATVLLEQNLRPDVILVDEGHNLKNRDASRTMRFLRYFTGLKGRRVYLCVWSGTLTDKSIKDFAHLSRHALNQNSPLPLKDAIVDQWAAAVDPTDWPADPGELMRLAEPGEELWPAFNRRLVDTLGVISTRATDSCGASIYIRERKPPKMPDELREMIVNVRKEFKRPDKEELVQALDVQRCAQQLACGFYYRWRFPGSPSQNEVDEWFEARRLWGQEMRDKLKRAKPHMDSPQLLANAAERYHTGYEGDLPVWDAEHWCHWRDIKNTIKHETQAVWVSDFLVRDAAEWATSHRGIIWYDFVAFGEAIAKMTGYPLHTGGPKAQARIKAETGKTSIIASIDSHGTGRDGLQFLFDEQLIANPPASGKLWEQLLGRLHRQGQKADEVPTWVYRHTPEMRDSFDRARHLAKYVEGILSATQKLLSATIEFPV